MMFYCRELVIPWASKKLVRPNQSGIEDRRENFYATTQERGQIHDVEIALEQGWHILGLKDVFLHDSGAYDPYGLTIPLNTQCHAMGGYDIRISQQKLVVVFTNKPSPLQFGSGRPQASSS